MAKTKRKAITLPSTGLTYEDLRAIEDSTPSSDENPTSLPLDRIFVADDVFQPREGLEAYHVRNLVGALKDNSRPFDKILVVAIGERHFVVDGHHRLAAYYEASWSEEVPVDVFPGNLDMAEAASIGNNSKDKLAVPKSRKLEKAWTMTKRQVLSISQISYCTQIAKRTVSYMRTRLRELGAEEAASMTWAEVKQGRLKGGDWDAEAWIEEAAEAMRGRVCDVHNIAAIIKSPEVFGTMIERVNPELIPGLLGRWIADHPELIEEFLQDQSIQEDLDL